MKETLFQPGRATVNFGKGHRVPYASPAKVYIIVSAISIAAMSIQSDFGLGVAIPGLEADADFQKTVSFLFPFINLLSPFLTAGILVVLQRKFLFQLHLAFSLHIWAFYIAVATPILFIPQASIWAVVGFLTLCIVGVGYVFLAHRRVYNVPWYERFVVVGAVLLSIPVASLLFILFLFVLASLLS
jgi:hypothetical protein